MPPFTCPAGRCGRSTTSRSRALPTASIFRSKTLAAALCFASSARSMIVRSPRSFALGLLAGAAALLPQPTAAQSTDTTLAARGGASERPQLRVRAVPVGIRLDGRLDDPAWWGADSAQLTQVEPHEGAIPTGRTVVRVLTTGDAIIVGIRADASRLRLTGCSVQSNFLIGLIRFVGRLMWLTCLF